MFTLTGDDVFTTRAVLQLWLAEHAEDDNAPKVQGLLNRLLEVERLYTGWRNQKPYTPLDLQVRIIRDLPGTGTQGAWK